MSLLSHDQLPINSITNHHTVQLNPSPVNQSQYTGLGNETGKFQNIKKSSHEFFVYLLFINENVLCQFEHLCFENNALKLASVSTHAFLKSGPETVRDLSQHLHRNCSHLNLF